MTNKKIVILTLETCWDILVNVMTGFFMAMLWVLALYIYLNKEEFVLGWLSSTLLGVVTCIILYTIGRGTKENW